jgi:FkbM family methyltransferase
MAYGYPSFSQYGEDRILEQLFLDETDGFYVDVGAFHPVMWSNTFLLYRRGWRGITVEPNPSGRIQLERRRPRDITLPYAISDEEGRVEFLIKGLFSGINDESYLWSKDGRPITVPTRTLASILSEYVPSGRTIDLLSIDCEGHDLKVLRSNDWERFRPRVVLVESIKCSTVSDFMTDIDYSIHATVGGTKVFTSGQ